MRPSVHQIFTLLELVNLDIKCHNHKAFHRRVEVIFSASLRAFSIFSALWRTAHAAFKIYSSLVLLLIKVVCSLHLKDLLSKYPKKCQKNVAYTRSLMSSLTIRPSFSLSQYAKLRSFTLNQGMCQYIPVLYPFEADAEAV